MGDRDRDIPAKNATNGSTAPVTPDTCSLQLECPVCGWTAEGVRCVRCGALKVLGCSGSCGGCGGCASPG